MVSAVANRARPWIPLVVLALMLPLSARGQQPASGTSPGIPDGWSDGYAYVNGVRLHYYRRASEEAASVMKQGRLAHIDGAGHNLHHDDLPRTVEVLNEFLCPGCR